MVTDNDNLVNEKNEGAKMLAELAETGFMVKHVDDLRRSGTTYRAAIPVLLKWLPRIKSTPLKEAVVRVLTVPWAKGIAAPVLINEFKTANMSSETYKWAIGNALEVVADDTVLCDMVTLARDQRHGTSRQMIVLGLGHMKDPRAVDALLDLLADDEVVGHAISALGKLGALKAHPALERFLKHEKPWIRREAKKALDRIKRESMRMRRRNSKRDSIQ